MRRLFTFVLLVGFALGCHRPISIHHEVETIDAIGILAALPQELKALQERVATCDAHTEQTFIGSRPVYVSLSGMGKVNAALSAESLIREKKVKALIFIGVAGGLDSKFEIGDIVLPEKTFQHDVGFFGPKDFKRHSPGVLPELGLGSETPVEFILSQSWPNDTFSRMTSLASKHVAVLEPIEVNGKPYQPKIHVGALLATGDQFIANEGKKKELKKLGVGLVDMEGAAVAQVATKYHVPLFILRAISDKAGSKAKLDFTKFFETVAHNNAKLLEVVFHELPSHF